MHTHRQITNKYILRFFFFNHMCRVVKCAQGQQSCSVLRTATRLSRNKHPTPLNNSDSALALSHSLTHTHALTDGQRQIPSDLLKHCTILAISVDNGGELGLKLELPSSLSRGLIGRARQQPNHLSLLATHQPLLTPFVRHFSPFMTYQSLLPPLPQPEPGVRHCLLSR